MAFKQRFRVVVISIVVSLLSFISLCLGVVIVYIGISYSQKDDPPAAWDVKVVKDVAPGQSLEANVYNLNRFKLCPYRRFVTVADNAGQVWNAGEVPGYPPSLLGKNPDINFFVNLDSRAAPGPASMRVTIEYSCAGNFFHAVLNEPVVISKTTAFNVLKPSGE